MDARDNRLPDDSAATEATDADRLLTRPPGYYDEYLFSVGGFATGVPDEDKRFLAVHPEATERWRAYLPGEAVPEPPGVTDTYAFEGTYFDGTRRGVWNRMFLRRSERPRRDGGR